MRNFVSSRSGLGRRACIAICGIAMTGLVASTIFFPTPVRAETKIFFVENQPDGYGIDQCLASGAKCGKPMASAYCQSRQYGEAVSFRKAGPEEMPRDSGEAACSGSGCVDFVAIECQR